MATPTAAPDRLHMGEPNPVCRETTHVCIWLYMLVKIDLKKYIYDRSRESQWNMQEFILVTVMQMDADSSQYMLTHITQGQ